MIRLLVVFLTVVTLAAGCFTPSFEATNCGAGETCPDGQTCTPLGLCARCGDGVVLNGEVCDDGNATDEDDCRNDCQPNVCGDRVVDRQGPITEECDEGGVDTATCDDDCTFARCGDEHVNELFVAEGAPHGEICDDGNTTSGDKCSADCASLERCGDGYVNDDLPNTPSTAPSLCLSASNIETNCAEVCDDGNNVSGDDCSANCLSTGECGNGILDPGELCDDGNDTNSDACDNDCRSGGGCGNGAVESALGEQCDAGQVGVNTAGCDSDCTIPICGDAIANNAAGEACDPGAVGAATATCDADCTPPECGDGFVNHAADEVCDPASPNTNVATCDRDCSVPVCGDGLVNAAAGEECDDGNAIVTDNCPVCRVARCGDGIIDLQAPGIETCDDGNTADGDSCPSDCTIP